MFKNKAELEGFVECVKANPQKAKEGLIAYLEANRARTPCPRCGQVSLRTDCRNRIEVRRCTAGCGYICSAYV